MISFKRIVALLKLLKDHFSGQLLWQLVFPKTIPVVIVNFNQLFYLQKQVDFYLNRGFKNIVIIDNLSTYPPLLHYYKTIEPQVKIEYMKENWGHLVFFEKQEIYQKYGSTFVVISDADIVPNPNLPHNFMRTLINTLLDNYKKVLKVGFALRLDDIPCFYPNKEKVLQWEQQYWDKKIAENLYEAHLDTTFALYKPNPKHYIQRKSDFYNAIRIGDDFTAQHGGWYIDYENLTEEQEFYIKNASTSSSWIDTHKTNRESPIQS